MLEFQIRENPDKTDSDNFHISTTESTIIIRLMCFTLDKLEQSKPSLATEQFPWIDLEIMRLERREGFYTI